MARSATLLLVLALSAVCVQAYPGLWLEDQKEYKLPCTAHPTKAEGAHKAPTPDRDIKFVVKDAAGAAAKEACPGSTYSVTVLFPEKRLAFITTTVGTLSSTAPGVLEATDKACPKRVWLYGAPNKTASVPMKWAVPCGAAASAVLEVTSAAGSDKGYNAAKTTVPITAACAAASCPGAAKGAVKGAAPAAGGDAAPAAGNAAAGATAGAVTLAAAAAAAALLL